MAFLLEPFGFDSRVNAVYLALVEHPRASVAELAEQAAVDLVVARRALKQLVGRGLANRLITHPPRYVATPPDVAVDTLVARQQEILQGARAAAGEVAARLCRAEATQGATSMVQLVEGPEAVLQCLAQIQASARDEVLLIDAPPYLHGFPRQNNEELAALRRNVRYRSIYHAPALDLPEHLDQMLACVDAGEQARTLPNIRMKMQIVDRSCAVVPLAFDGPETRSRLLVRPSPLLDALIRCFESLWHQATPIAAPSERDEATACSGLDKRDRQLLTLMAAGRKDQAIARALHVTDRTIGRRVTELMNQLGAETRFQAGIEATRRGWI